MDLSYWLVDAFTDRLFTGNPAAVLLPETALPDALMQSIAAENNLSETAFAVAEGDAYRLRWFTPTVEVDLCGHATLATSFILAKQGNPGPFLFHTRSGPLTATVIGPTIELDFPARTATTLPPSEAVAQAIGAEPAELLECVGLVAVLDSAKTVANLRANTAAIRALPGGTLAVTAAGGHGAGEGADITSRFFAPAYGIDEDPVTGSLHTRVVPYWAGKLGRHTLICHQASPRGGRLTCTHAGDRVRMAGTAVLYAHGTLAL